MRKLLLFFVTLLILNQNASANYAGAGELVYQWVSDSTYRFYFILYADCAASTEPDTVSLCFRNTCLGTNFTRTMTKTSATPTRPYIYCNDKYKSQCDSPASTIPGYKVWTYAVTATLPERCNDWNIAATVDNRNNSNNISVATSTPFTAEVRFNNTGTNLQNSSPYFTASATAYIYNNTPYTYDAVTIDPDGDSLVFETITPLTRSGSCSNTTGSVGFSVGTPTLAVPQNPFQTNNTYTTNPATGALFFIPDALGKNSTTILVKEYRNGTYIGSVTRDIQFAVSPAVTIKPPVLIQSVVGTPTACTGNNLNFTYSIYSADTEAMYMITDDHSTATPGSTITYNANGSDSVTGTFNWIPTAANAGYNNIIITIQDTACRFPDVNLSYTYTISVYVNNGVKILNDTAICPGGSTPLTVINGGNYTWSVLPGGTSGSLSCTTCASPVATPLVTTRYVAVSGLVGGCPPDRDTVTVTIDPSLTYNPVISIIATPAPVAWPGFEVTFTATDSGCTTPKYVWAVNGVDLPGNDTSSWSSSTLSPGDVVSCKLLCSDMCSNPSVTSNGITMILYTGISSVDNSKDITIYPNPNNGSFAVKSTNPANSAAQVEIINTLGQVVYKKTLDIYNGQQTIDMGNVPHGTYTLRVNQHTYKFTVSK